jgi:hypothetical protein
MRYGLVTTFLWIGALKFTDYEVGNAEPLVTASPLSSRLRKKLGAQKLARLVGVTQITLGSLIAAKPVAPPGLGGWQLRGRGDDAQYAQLPGHDAGSVAGGAGGDTAAVCAGREPIEGRRAPRRRPPDGCRIAASRSRR